MSGVVVKDDELSIVATQKLP